MAQTDVPFTVATFNMHGMNQGITTLEYLCNNIKPSVIFLQEHWLSSINCEQLVNFSSLYSCFFSSAMEKIIESGMLRGRPFGGVAILIRNDLVANASVIAKSDRYIIVTIGSLVLVNIYASSSSNANDKYLINADLISQIDEKLDNCADLPVVIGGDFNIDLQENCKISTMFKDFFKRNNSTLGINAQAYSQSYTYSSASLGSCSMIDFIAVNNELFSKIVGHDVLDYELNYSDHLPVLLTFNAVDLQPCLSHDKAFIQRRVTNVGTDQEVKVLRWDHADLMEYYFSTLESLCPINEKICNIHESFISGRTDFSLFNDGPTKQCRMYELHTVKLLVKHIMTSSFLY